MIELKCVICNSDLVRTPGRIHPYRCKKCTNVYGYDKGVNKLILIKTGAYVC